jgi:hypothetical protein
MHPNKRRWISHSNTPGRAREAALRKAKKKTASAFGQDCWRLSQISVNLQVERFNYHPKILAIEKLLEKAIVQGMGILSLWGK